MFFGVQVHQKLKKGTQKIMHQNFKFRESCDDSHTHYLYLSTLALIHTTCNYWQITFFNPLHANPTKWSNTSKQFVGC